LPLNEKGPRGIVRKMGILFIKTELLPANVELFANMNRSVLSNCVAGEISGQQENISRMFTLPQM